MCPADDSHLTLEFDDHFVICPSIQFCDRGNIFSTNGVGETGLSVSQGYEYNSGTNEIFLDVNEIREFDKWAEL